MKGAFRLGLGFSLLGVILIGLATTASAERFTGGSYQIDASVIGNSFGGSQTGGSYQLTSSGGESVIGQGSGGSYKLDSGYVAQLQQSMQLSCNPMDLSHIIHSMRVQAMRYMMQAVTQIMAL